MTKMIKNKMNYKMTNTINQKPPPEVFCKKGVLRNFAEFTGKHLCQSLFFIKLPILRNLEEQLFLQNNLRWLLLINQNIVFNAKKFLFCS